MNIYGIHRRGTINIDSCKDHTQSDVSIIETMRAAGAQLIYLDIETPYFQYGRTYRGVGRNGIERLDRRLFIYVHSPDDVQVLFYPNGLERSKKIRGDHRSVTKNFPDSSISNGLSL